MSIAAVTADIGWGWGEAGFWMLLAVIVLAALGAALFVITRGGVDERDAPADSPPAPPSPAAAKPSREPEPEPRHVTERDVVAVVTFPHTERAEHAYAEVRQSARGAAWLEEVAFVEVRRHGRIVVRGTFAGHYLDVDDAGEVIGRDTAVGALTGAAVGLAFGPPGVAVGLVGGGIAGAADEAHHHPPRLDGELYDQIRADVEEGSSALVVLGSPADADAMTEALAGHGGRPTRHELTRETAQAFDALLAQAPRASHHVS